jgi:hypothetical protein
MADDINKITIDVQVNADGQQQVEQYKASFESLRTTINNLGKPIADLSKTIGSLNNDLSQLASVNEKNAAKILDTLKKNSDQQAKVYSANNQALKASLSEADEIKERALIKELQNKFKYYGMTAAAESDQYKERKKKLDDLFKQKGMSQKNYNAEAEKLLKDHYGRMQQIIDQYIKSNSSQNQQLVASGISNISTPALTQPDVKSAKFPPVKLPPPDPGFFERFVDGFKSTFSTILSYYKKNEKAKSKTAIDSANKTNTTVAAAEKTAMDKKLTSAIANAQKIEDTISGIATKAIDARAKQQIASQEAQKTKELANTSLSATQKETIIAGYQKRENAINKKAFLEKQRISIGQAVINGAIAITKSEADLGPIAGTIAIAEIVASTAAQIATIAAQKPPALAKGGYFTSDGKGALLPGYSRSDNTNAHLRSGEAVVVSEAMRDPWARNLVSAINVAYGGRDFSVPNLNRGYAVGGIFTDGGNANRYYNQPMNDQKNLANTIAYQMINNFPPVYVDVKDVNNQQNILAQTINRVNL